MGETRAGVYARQSKGGKKSIADQLTLGRAAVEEHGWALAWARQDGVGASAKTRKVREAWPEVLAAIAAGDVDVLVLWESSRGDRRLTYWSALLDTCREVGVLVHVISDDHTYDVRNPRDWETLASEGIKSEAESHRISARTRRGLDLSAKAGRPTVGYAAYGLSRLYDEHTGELVGQRYNDDSPVAKDIITRIAKAEPLTAIRRDLHARGILSPKGGEWWSQHRLAALARNPVYIGKRRHNGMLLPGTWGELVDIAVWRAAQRVLDDPGRRTHGPDTRPGKQKHLLTGYALCDGCQGRIGARAESYRCRDKGCVTVKRADVDKLIEDLVRARLKKPDVYRALRKRGEASDAEVARLRNEAARLQQELDEWRLSAVRKVTTKESLAVAEAELQPQIDAANAAADRAGLPPELHPFVAPGADVDARWAEASVTARRTVMRVLGLRVALLPSGNNGHLPAHARVDAKWPGEYGSS